MAEQSVEINQSLVALNTTLEKIPAALDTLKQQLVTLFKENNTVTIKQLVEANNSQYAKIFEEINSLQKQPTASDIFTNALQQMFGKKQAGLALPKDESALDTKEEKVRIRSEGHSVNLIGINEETLRKLKLTLKNGFKQGLQEFLDDNPDAFCCPKNDTFNFRRPRRPDRPKDPIDFDKPPINIPLPPPGIPYGVPIPVSVINTEKQEQREREATEKALKTIEKRQQDTFEKRQREIEEEIKLPKSIEVEIKQPEVEVPKPLAPSLPEQIAPSKATEVKLPETVTAPKEPSLRDKIKPAYGFENDMLASDKFTKSTGWERFGRAIFGNNLYDTITGKTNVEDYLKNNWADIVELLLLGSGGKTKAPGQRVTRPIKNVTPVEAKPAGLPEPTATAKALPESAAIGRALSESSTAKALPEPSVARALPEPVITRIPNPIESVTIKTVPDITPKKITAQSPLTKAGQGLEPATKTSTTEFDVSTPKQFKPETQPLVRPEKATNLFEVAEPVPAREVPEIKEYLKELNEVSVNLKNAVKQISTQTTSTGNGVLNSVNDSRQTFNTFNTYTGAGEEITSSRIKTELLQNSFRLQY